jgi:hypothetical protein
MNSSTEWLASVRRRRLGASGLPARCLVIGAAAAWLVACSDAKRSQTPGFSDRLPSATQTGVFKAGNVAGLDFVADNRSGVTDSRGRFTCTTGRPVAFSIGHVDLGDTVCATLAHPAALTASGSLTDPAALNMTRLLLMLDHDQNPDNGIEISAPLQSLADSWPAVDFSAADFEAELPAIVSDVASAEGRANVVLPSSAEAFVYLDASLSCAYSGIFVNTFVSGYLSALTQVAMRVYREPASGIDDFEVRIRRDHPQSQLFLDATGTVELKALPELINSAQPAIGSVQASYRTPDAVDGSWSGGVAQQAIDRSGYFEAVRIGYALGDYRFTGVYSRVGDTGTPIPLGVVTLTLDGDALGGEMFDLRIGGAFDVSGRRLAGSDMVEISAGTPVETATAQLLTDASGTPIGLVGDWPGVAGSTVDAVACRLN